MIFLVITAFLSFQRAQSVDGGSLSTVTIDTDNVTLKWERGGVSTDLRGITENRTFTYRDKEWSYQVAVYRLNSTFDGIFAFESNVIVRGRRAMLVNITGNVVMNTTINASAVAVGTSMENFHLGGFSLTSTNCCYVGAGPGAGFTFHGGGHGGVGGGSWIDTTTNISYGKNYQMSGILVGGSSGAFMYDSNPGSGGGVVALHATGVLTVGSKGRILANGYNVKDTTFPACSGGSAGGRIHLTADIVVVEGELSVMGGNSGISSNYSDYCGDGGGGGVILIRALDIRFSNLSTVHHSGGRGLENGSIGLFDPMSIISGAVAIDTSQCEMTFLGTPHKKLGILTTKPVLIDCDLWNQTICTFTFDTTVKFNSTAAFIFTGENALRIVAELGDIIVETKIDVTGNSAAHKTVLGGYLNYAGNNPGPGSKANSAAHGNINDTRSYGIWPVLLLGGSSCTNDTRGLAIGGGALALEAKRGRILVDANISADARPLSQSSRCGASGGTIILDAGHVIINAFVTANGCDGEIEGGAGGVVKTSNRSSRILVRAGTGQNLNLNNEGIVLEGPDYQPTVYRPSRSCRISSSSVPSVATSNIWSSSSFIDASHTSHYSTQSLMTSSAASTIGLGSSEQSAAPSLQLNSSYILTMDVSQTQSLADTSHVSQNQRGSSVTSLATSTLDVVSSDVQTLVSSAQQLSSHVTPTASSSYQAMQSSAFVGGNDVVSKQFKNLVGAEVNSSTALNISSALANALASSSRITHRDTMVAMNIIGQLSNRSIYAPRDVGEAMAVTTNVISSCSKIAKLSFDSEGQNKRSTGLVPQMARHLENLGESISAVLKPEETFIAQDDTIAIEVTVVAGNSSVDRFVPVSNISNSIQDNVTIPKEAFARIPGNVGLTLVVITTNSTYNQSITVDGKPVQTASNIISVSINSENLEALERSIVIWSKLRKEPPKHHLIRGGFWQEKSQEHPHEGWSYAGCSSIHKGGYVEIKCNHMTSFAVLLSVTEQKLPDHHKEALSLITYIGCGISLFGLLMTFAAYVTLDNLDPERATIHTNLVVALGIAQIVFLAGISATGNKIACTTVAVLLHYFFTAAFSWMFAEGIQLYTKIVSVFSHGNKLKFYYVMGWGLPVIVVALSAGIRPDGYGTDTACWISIEAGLIWAFVAPVAVVIIINFIILILVVKILISSVSTVQVDSKTSQETNKSMQQIKAGAKAMIILMPILGLSWVFGILAVNEATMVFQYLFCIFNSLQGFFIFIVYVIGNSEVRSAFKRLQEKHSLSRSVGERSYALRSISKKARNDSQGEEILVRRETGSSLGSPGDERMITSKTLSAGQISLNSLNCPMPLEDNS